MESNKNVGIWIRVSTDMQVQDESPEHHEKRARNYADAKGWNVVTIYRLDAMSGKSVLEYPETKRMLKDIDSGTITGIIFSKLARLARNTKELLEISEIFRGRSADLISLAEAIDTSTPAGRLFFTVIAAMAQWEREEIADRVAASVPIRAKMGKPLGGQASFGYIWEGKEFKIVPEEAPIRKLVYEIFQKTKRKRATASELNNLGYRTRKGSLFSDTTIERLLKDPTAKGLRRANYTKSLGEGKNWVMKPESDWIEIPCPAIVDENLWNDCNMILTQQEKKRIKVGPRTVYLLAGYVYCTCGSKMYVFSESPVYKCKKCKRKIDVQDIDEIYHEQLKSFLLTDSDVTKLSFQTNEIISEKESLLKTISKEYDKLLKKTEQQTNLRMGGELSKEEFARFYKSAEQQLRQIEDQMPELEAEIDFLKIQYLSSDTVIQEAKDLYNNWNNLPFEEKRSIIETITEHIIIDNESINISLSYLPTPRSLLNSGNKQRNIMGSWRRST
ncbi:MAG: recombinase family protein [Ferruginibacter sp.]